MPGVHECWQKSKERSAVHNPKTVVERTALREYRGVILWETVEATFAEGEVGQGRGKGGVEGERPKPPMLLLRLKALKQIGKLYGLEERKKAKRVEPEPVACATPEEIAALVGEWRRRREGER